jgi:hypothetical protein
MRSPSKQFIPETTSDGSPTLRLISDPLADLTIRTESMHHSGGAASETQYIYGNPIRQALQKDSEVNFLVVGLGLGYIEMLMASVATGRAITSYEIDSELRQNFLEWTQGSEKFEIYDQVCRSLKLEPDFVRSQIQKNHLKLCAELSLNTVFEQKNHVICFDAFSQKTSGTLWTEEFLNYFITNACAEDCVFTTYACTGLLKRTLEKNGFHFEKRAGFIGKRNSTLATRGKFKNS